MSCWRPAEEGQQRRRALVHACMPHPLVDALHVDMPASPQAICRGHARMQQAVMTY